jgi:hypothetical protein
LTEERKRCILSSKKKLWKIELSALTRQCLPERIDSKQRVEEQIHFWQEQRNQDEIKINWRFTTEDARIKLKQLYPSVT